MSYNSLSFVKQETNIELRVTSYEFQVSIIIPVSCTS
jgi:hypothetical protein